MMKKIALFALFAGAALAQGEILTAIKDAAVTEAENQAKAAITQQVESATAGAKDATSGLTDSITEAKNKAAEAQAAIDARKKAVTEAREKAEAEAATRKAEREAQQKAAAAKSAAAKAEAKKKATGAAAKAAGKGVRKLFKYRARLSPDFRSVLPCTGRFLLKKMLIFEKRRKFGLPKAHI